jgi:hypothetical protein
VIEGAGITSQAPPERYRWPELGWHLLALALICSVRFAANHDRLLSDVDGSYATFSQYPGVLFTDPRSVLNVSPYFGFGATFPGPSPFIDPFGLVLHITGSVVAAYVLLAIIIFLAIYALARALGTSTGVALASGWVMVVAVLPAIGHHLALMVEVASILHPSSTYVIPLFCVVVTLFIYVGRYSLRWNAAIAAFFLLIIVASWINNLTFMVLALPFTAVALAILTVTADSWSEATWKIACVVFAIGLFAWLGIGAFLDSFTAYSHRLDSMFGVVTGLLASQRVRLLNLVNHLYEGRIIYFFLGAAPLLGWVGLAGLVQGMMLGNLRWRLLCLAALAGVGGLTLMGSEYSLPGVIWPWAAPGYFERASYPIYVIAAVLLAEQLAIYARAHYANFIGRAPLLVRDMVQHPRRYHKRGLAIAVVLAATVSLIGTGPKTLARQLVAAQVTFPPPDSPWRRVAQLVPVRKGQPFKGWFADLSAAASLDYPKEVALNIQVWLSGGGTLLAMPAEGTLHDAGMRRLQGIVPFDRRIALLGAFGLAYVTKPKLQADDLFVPVEDSIPDLFRVRAANLGDFSPIETLTVEDFDKFETMVAGMPIDWRRTVVLDPGTAKKVGSGLVAARHVTNPIVVTNGLRLEAETDGRSLLLLPRQFSNCYVWRPDPGSSDKVMVVRANMLQAALLFEGSIKGKFDYVYRWGGASRCRAKDPVQARELGIRAPHITEGRFGPLGAYVMLPAQNRALERNLLRAGQ